MPTSRRGRGYSAVITPRARLAWTSDVRVEAVKVGFDVIVSAVVRPGGIVDIETAEFVGEHWCDVVMKAKFEGYEKCEDAKIGGWWWW